MKAVPDLAAVRYVVLRVALLAFACLMCMAVLLWRAAPARAGGQVGNGTPQSCTPAELDAKMSTGGDVTFNCGGASTAINLSHQLSIVFPTSMRGDGLITLSAGNAFPLIYMYPGTALTLTGMALTQGKGTYGAVLNSTGSTLVISGSQIVNNWATVNGGAVENYGTLLVYNSLILNNTANSGAGGGIGGGIYNGGGSTLTLAGSTLSGNQASVTGGALYLVAGSSATVLDSEISSNSADSRGAAMIVLSSARVTVSNSRILSNTTPASAASASGVIYNNGAVTLTGVLVSGNSVAGNTDVSGGVYNTGNGTARILGSTFAGNRGTRGGALYNAGAMSLVNVTLSGNRALTYSINVSTTSSGEGGGVYNSGSLYMTDTDVISNSAASSGGGLWNFTPGAATLYNSIVAYNNSPAGGNCAGAPVASGDTNLSSDATCALYATHDLSNTNPLLGPLGDHFGPTPTHLPQPDSPVVDHGACFAVAPTDQRGVTRPQGSRCDIGSVEVSRLDTPGVFLPVVVR